MSPTSSPEQAKNVDYNLKAQILLIDVTGALDKPLNIANLAKAIA